LENLKNSGEEGILKKIYHSDGGLSHQINNKPVKKEFSRKGWVEPSP